MKRLRNQNGQLTMEAVLILAIFSSLALFVMKTARTQGWAASVVEGPWGTIRGMIEDGVWQNAKDSKANHPGQFKRHHSHQGTEVDAT